MAKPTLREFAKYTITSIIAMIGLSCYILADTFFISKDMGELGLAALNISCPAFNVVFALGLMIGFGGATKFAIHKGAKEYQKANSIFTHTVIVVGVLSVFFVLLGLFASGPVAIALGADAQTYDLCKVYTQIILCFAPFFMFNTVFQDFVRNDGAPRLVMIATLAGNLFNIVFDYVFIFPCKMHMLGAALATGISPVISILILAVFFFARKKNTFKIAKCKFSLRTVLQGSALGLPAALGELSVAVVMIIFNRLLLQLGNDTAVAAYAVVVNVAYVVNAIINGVAQGTQPIVSFNYGEGNVKKIKEVMKYAIITTIAMSIIMYTVICAGAGGICSIFNSEKSQELQDLASLGLRLFFISALFSSLNILFSTYFSSSNRAIVSQFLTILRGFITIIPLAFLFARLFDITGLWLATPTAEAITLIVCVIMYVHNKKKLPIGNYVYVRQ